MLKLASNKHPSTRYQGSKLKLVEWIWNKIDDMNLEFDTFFDSFGGTGSIGFQAKKYGKEVHYNDILKYNYQIGKSIIENNKIKLNNDDVEFILNKNENIKYSSFVEKTFNNIYFTKEENNFIDIAIQNIQHLNNQYKKSIAYSTLGQACISKRPFNLFHRKNLYIRTHNVNRRFGNKTTWEKPFSEHFKKFVEEYNNAIFNNNKNNKAFNMDIFNSFNLNEYDMVYIDIPYTTSKKLTTDYYTYYHFLEGMVDYNNWSDRIDWKSKNLKLKSIKNQWNYKQFPKLFEKFKNSYLVVSYRNNGEPSIKNLEKMLKKHKKNVKIFYKEYKYALQRNSNNKEVLLIGI